MPIPIDSYEKLYWTDDPEPTDPNAIWYEESWKKSGTTEIKTGSTTDLSTNQKSSIYWYPSDVKFIMATDGAIAPGIVGQTSWVIVKVYADSSHKCGISGSNCLQELEPITKIFLDLIQVARNTL